MDAEGCETIKLALPTTAPFASTPVTMIFEALFKPKALLFIAVTVMTYSLLVCTIVAVKYAEYEFDIV